MYKNSTIIKIDNKLYRRGVGMVIMRNDHIWIGERSDTKNAWQMPQGGIDTLKNDEVESEESAMLRELMEEVGTNNVNILHKMDKILTYDFPKDILEKFLKISRHEITGQALTWFFLEFLGDDNEFAIGKEFKRWKWANKNEIINSITDFKKPMYESVFNLLDILLKRI